MALLFKHYRLLWAAVPLRISPLVSLQFCFTPGRQPMDATKALRIADRKAKQWCYCLFIASAGWAPSERGVVGIRAGVRRLPRDRYSVVAVGKARLGPVPVRVAQS